MFTPTIQNVAIEDDEILDLDSISLDSNEDTWLYSSNTSTVDSSGNINFSIDEETKEKKLFAFQENKSSICDANVSPDSSLFSPGLIKSDDDCHESFLNSFDKMSESQYDLLCRTPLNTSKTKCNMLRKVFSTPRQGSNQAEKNFSSVAKTELSELQNDGVYPLIEQDTFVFKKPTCRRDSSDKSSILHSVENKLFTITDTEANELKSIQNREIRSADGIRKTISVIKQEKHYSEINDYENMDEKKETSKNKTTLITPTNNQKVNQSDVDSLRTSETKALENNENIFKKSLPLWHSTPQTNLNGDRLQSKKSLLLQPSPLLLSRYLKYNKIEDKNVKQADLLGSSESLKEETNNKHDKNEMNVSYIKYSRDCIDSKTGLHCASDDNIHIKSNLNATFSKSDDVLSSPSKSHTAELNSADELAVEDDILSSTSESSSSSMGNKHPLSIMDVRKLAKRQEMSLKQHIRSSYYAGSSKSSEVSSSSESICAFGGLSSSNETNIEYLRTANPQKTVTKNKLSYAKMKNESEIQPRFSTATYNRSGLRLNFQKKTDIDGVVKKASMLAEEAKPNTIVKNRSTPTNGISLNNKQISNKKQFTQRAPSLTRQAVPQMKVDDEFVSVKEIKSRDNTEVKTMIAAKSTENSGPVSHIPRPSSRIPMLRSSASCTRYNNSTSK